jgi:catechol 2,3-dioxygenase-like lactoylglutathione lyase family enzyme
MLVESMGAAVAGRHADGMNLHRIDHVSLDVRDRVHSLAWYEAILGLRPAGAPGPVDQPVFLGPRGARLGLFQERPPGMRHIALATDAAEQGRVLDRLERLAVPYRRERHRDHDSLYFADPDGATLEIMVPTA